MRRPRSPTSPRRPGLPARPCSLRSAPSRPCARSLTRPWPGDDEPVPVASRPWFRPGWDASTQDGVLAAYAGVCTLIGGRAAAVFEAVRRAAGASPEAAELWGTLQGNRRAGAHMVVQHLQKLGPLRPGLGTRRATDLLWVFNDPAKYHALVLQCGWAESEFTGWLATQMRQALLSA